MMNSTIWINGEKVVVPAYFCDEGKQFPTSIPCKICCDEICLEFEGTDPLTQKPKFKQICSHKYETKI